MVTGVHAVLFTTDADADRAFFRDVLEFPSVDAGGGWLIFGLPPAELAAHPNHGDGRGARANRAATRPSSAIQPLDGKGSWVTEFASASGQTAVAVATTARRARPRRTMLAKCRCCRGRRFPRPK